MQKFGIAVLTLNAASFFSDWYKGFLLQNTKPEYVLVIDSSSNDGTKELIESLGIRVFSIDRSSFDHGATRQLAISLMKELDFIVFMTQDVKFYDSNTLQNILDSFKDPRVALAYGKQIPHINEKPFGIHSRLFSYTDISEIRSIETIDQYKARSIFCSNSFSCYRVKALQEIGGFPSPVVLAEDLYVAGKLILANWKVAYVPLARVYHSHNYSILQEGKRYFDLGVFYSSNSWIAAKFGKNESHGVKFLISELRYILTNKPIMLPLVLIRNSSKYIFFKLGSFHKFLPTRLSMFLTMNKSFFSRKNNAS